MQLDIKEQDTLIDAIGQGDLDKVQTYVSKKFILNFTGSDRVETPLTFAIVLNNFDIIKVLIENGADVNYIDDCRCAPLHLAIHKKSSLDIIKLLINNSADVNQLARYSSDNDDQSPQDTPLSVCVLNQHTEAAKLLIDEGADMCKQNSDKTSALTLAQKNNNTDILNYYFTPLGYAIFISQLNEARQLLENGADSCIPGPINKTPLLIAVETGSVEAVTLLLKFQAALTMPTALLEAINLGNIPIINLFVENNVIMNWKYRNGTTPLIRAVQVGNFDVVKILVENGADVNFTSNDSYPLYESLKLDNCDITKYLISQGAKMEAKFLLKDNLQCLRNLIGVEAQLKSVVLDAFKPFTLLKAVETKNALFMKYLLDQGLSINSYDKRQKSPLVTAAKNRSFPIVALLVDAGANIEEAQEEMEEFANESEDFEVYYHRLKHEPKGSKPFGNGYHETSD